MTADSPVACSACRSHARCQRSRPSQPGSSPSWQFCWAVSPESMIGYTLVDLQCDGDCSLAEGARPADRRGAVRRRDGDRRRARAAGDGRMARDRRPRAGRACSPLTNALALRDLRGHTRTRRRLDRPSRDAAPPSTSMRLGGTTKSTQHRRRDRVRPRRRGGDRRHAPPHCDPATRSSARRARPTSGTTGYSVVHRSDRRHDELRVRPADMVVLDRRRASRHDGRRGGVRAGARRDVRRRARRTVRGSTVARSRPAPRPTWRWRWSAPVSATTPTMRRAQAERLARMIGDVRDIRRTGSAAVDLCFVAAGRLDVYFEQYLNVWDSAAGELIAREAGRRHERLRAVDPSDRARCWPPRPACTGRSSTCSGREPTRVMSAFRHRISGIMWAWEHEFLPSRTTSAFVRR